LSYKKILVAFDGTEHSLKAFGHALDMAKDQGARLMVLSVAVPPEPPVDVELEEMLEEAEERFREYFKKLEDAARQKGVEMEFQIVVGHPAEQIIHQAKEYGADHIVVGHRGNNPLAEWLLGLVSKRVSTYAPCSVTVVR